MNENELTIQLELATTLLKEKKRLAAIKHKKREDYEKAIVVNRRLLKIDIMVKSLGKGSKILMLSVRLKNTKHDGVYKYLPIYYTGISQGVARALARHELKDKLQDGWEIAAISVETKQTGVDKSLVIENW